MLSTSHFGFLFVKKKTERNKEYFYWGTRHMLVSVSTEHQLLLYICSAVRLVDKWHVYTHIVYSITIHTFEHDHTKCIQYYIFYSLYNMTELLFLPFLRSIYFILFSTIFCCCSSFASFRIHSAVCFVVTFINIGRCYGYKLIRHMIQMSCSYLWLKP